MSCIYKFDHAGANGQNEILDLLIAANPDYTMVNYYGGSALIPACERGHVSTVRKLLEKTQIDVNLINNLGWTALLETVILGEGEQVHQEITSLLLKYNADPSIPDKDGVTALEHAKIKGFNMIVSILQSYII